jgi:hypothetical protein
MASVAFFFVQALVAVALQAAAINAFLQSIHQAGTPALAFPAVWQTLAALAAASLFARALHVRGSADHRAAFLHVFCVCLILPVAGQILFLCIALASKVFPANTHHVQFAEVEKPRFDALKSRVAYGAAARLRSKLDDHGAGVADRISAVVALRSLPTRITSDMLRDLLSDPVEDIRLLAYGIPNGAEDAVAQRILETTERLEKATCASEEVRLKAALAELHWELIYQNLVHGELRIHTLGRVDALARDALELDGKQGAMWYLLGRAALLRGNADDAESFMRRAQACRFPSERLLPWLAEAAFLKREYVRARQVLAQLDEGAQPLALRQTVNYWTR